jgi:hypothetical protein
MKLAAAVSSANHQDFIFQKDLTQADCNALKKPLKLSATPTLKFYPLKASTSSTHFRAPW